ncbi:CPBP family intramembrane glutamic endopeptidase [Bacillus toyonensis]|uniref:CPBP family intramembrane glutamic endopeptidase n=1 Tax=Bacillus toyonensis TaxID=155322 RepID=UPI002E1CE032|nr:CPBP family intramembrane metalloprotease [Bacillus toyonensis]
MTIIRMICLFIVMLGFMVCFGLIDRMFHLGLTSDSGIEVFLMPFIFILALIIVNPSLRKDFIDRFLIDKENIHQAICFPILAGIGMVFIANAIRFIPYWLWGDQLIGVGSKQVTTLEELTDTGLLISVSIIGPFTEEFLFRYLLYGGIFLLFFKGVSDSQLSRKIVDHLYVNKTAKYIWSWIIVTNIVFALMHGPNLLNFWMYLIPGMVDAWFFITYGFLASWLSHSMFNLFSGITLQILLSLFL